MITKVCSICGEEKPFDVKNWHTSRGKPCGTRCRQCRNKLQNSLKAPRKAPSAQQRICNVCGETKPLDRANWHFMHGAPVGSKCRKCRNLTQKTRYQKLKLLEKQAELVLYQTIV
jgi:bacterioferritin-associated ferredoxin